MHQTYTCKRTPPIANVFYAFMYKYCDIVCNVKFSLVLKDKVRMGGAFSILECSLKYMSAYHVSVLNISC